jgi:type IV pilus assembly protein PilC
MPWPIAKAAQLRGAKIMFSRQLPLSSLIEFTRAVRHNLAAGLTLVRVFKQQAERGPMPVRPVADRMARDLEQGDSLEEAIEKEKAHFPNMFVSLAVVGEQSGNLPEVLTDLEKYFVLLQRLWRDFYSRIAWPMIQFTLAPLIVAGMIYILGILNSPFDPLGLGLKGTSGALLFLFFYFGGFGAVVLLYFVLTRGLKHQAAVDDLLLRIPVIGPCLQAIALMRFCVALRLTMETGMPIASAVKLSMHATGNAAYESREELVRAQIKGGEDLTDALREASVFPPEFLDIMANAEEGGRVPEVMRHQAEYYEDEARRKLTILSQTASWGVYGIVAMLLIFMIFRFWSSYFSLLNSFGG